jgi:hypothetical protein
MEKLTANFIAFIISVLSIYFMSFANNWKLVLGIFLFVWANNIIMKYGTINK